jgi:hypothetical protein
LPAINAIKKTKQMKKLFLIISLASAVAFANAQDMTSKKGVPILPETDDWSIGFDATSLINYFGNLANGNTNNNSATLGPEQYLTLVGLCVDKNDASKAMRAKVRIGFGSSTSENPPYSGSDSLNSPSKIESSNGINVTLGAGMQKWRGKGRLKGFYGAEAQLMFGSGTSTTNTFAQAIDASHIPNNNSRTTESNGGGSFGLGVGGFIGAEYFFAPKMSISAEYGWGINFNSSGAGDSTTEEWDPTANSGQGAVKTTTRDGSSSSSFGIDVSNSGSITFHCYF